MASVSPEHGTRARYRAGCGCAVCKKWKADDTAKYRARRRSKESGEPVAEKPKRARPTRRPTPPVGPTSEPVTERRPAAGDELAQLIEDALWSCRGDSATASVVAADAIRAAGYRIVVGAVARATSRALGDPKSDLDAMRHEIVMRGAHVLDDPEAGRNYKSTVEAMRAVLADLKAGGGSADAARAIVDAIRGSGGSGDAASVGDSA